MKSREVILLGSHVMTLGHLRSNFGNVGSLAMTRVISTILQASFLIMLARSVSISDFGSYSSSVAVGSIASGILGFGLATRSLRLAAEGLTHLVVSHLAVGCISALAISCVVLTYAELYSGAIHWWAIAGALFVAHELLANIVQGLLFGDFLNKRAEMLLIGRRLIPFTFALGASFINSTWIFQGASTGFVVAIFFSIVLLGRHTWHGWNISEVLRNSWNYWLANIGSMLQQLDVPIIASFLGAASAGAFSGAFRLASPVHIVTSSLVSIYVPKLSHQGVRSERLKMGRGLIQIGVIYAGLVTLFAPMSLWIGPMLLGEEFRDFAWVFPILVLNSAISVVNQLQAARLYAEGCARDVAKSTIASTAFGLLVVLLGVSAGNLYLAASGTLSIQVLLVGLLALASARTSGEATVVEGVVDE